ncbi:MAG: AAA family ATPase, partial [Planctomycetota bacterium]
MSLFGDLPDAAPAGAVPRAPLAPLAERMRPRTLAEYLGQDGVVGEGRALRAAIMAGKAGSLLLWGPPGVGKTTLALLIAQHANLHFRPLSAVNAGVAQVREAVAQAQEDRARDGRGTLVFIDEIHRFNKAQQ